jgi:hypothetical protein
MTLDDDTFLVALYTIVDDLYIVYVASHKPVRPGPSPEVSDSEVLTLFILAQAYHKSEQCFLDYVARHWRAYFPRLLDRSAFNRRVRDVAGALMHLIPAIAAQLQAYDPAYQVLDCVPVPLMRICRGKQHRLFGGEATVGKGGSDKQWYYGCRLLLAVTEDGVVTGFTLGPASTEERWLAESLFCWRVDPGGTTRTAGDLPRRHRRGAGSFVGPTGRIWGRNAAGVNSNAPYITDNGFTGRTWTTHWQQDYGAVVLTPKSYTGEQARLAARQHAGWRQVIETVNSILDNLGLQYPGAHTIWGLLARLAAKIAAVNLGVWLNRLFGRNDLSVATLFSF